MPQFFYIEKYGPHILPKKKKHNYFMLLYIVLGVLPTLYLI